MPTKREQNMKRLAALEAERRPWEPIWEDIGTHVYPHGLVQRPQDKPSNRGRRLDSDMVNNLPLRALGVHSSGLTSGITNPSLQWYGLTVADKDLAKSARVKRYFDECRAIIDVALHTSGWYRALSTHVYPSLGAFGTGAMGVMEAGAHIELRRDGARVMPTVRFPTFSVGEFWIDTDHNDRVDVWGHRRWMTVRQLVQKFGLEACSRNVRRDWDKGDYNSVYRVAWLIVPNEEYDSTKRDRRGMRYASCWWEEHDDRRDKMLRESGFHEFPMLVPRWLVRGREKYGRGPGGDALGDCQELQHHEVGVMEMVDKTKEPPMKGTDGVDGMTLIPGQATILPKEDANARWEPALTIHPNSIAVTQAHKAEVEQRIRETFHVHLWQAFLNNQRRQPETAAEIYEKRRELVQLLGGTMHNLDRDLLAPGIERLYSIYARAGAFPTPPEELQGMEVHAEFVSVMHKLQKASERSSLHVFIADVGNLAQMRGDALDKIDVDKAVDHYAEGAGVPADVVRSSEEVAKVRQARAEREAAKEQGDAAMAATEGARNLSGVEPGKLRDLAESVAPAAAAQAGFVGSAGP